MLRHHEDPELQSGALDLTADGSDEETDEATDPYAWDDDNHPDVHDVHDDDDEVQAKMDLADDDVEDDDDLDVPSDPPARKLTPLEAVHDFDDENFGTEAEARARRTVQRGFERLDRHHDEHVEQVFGEAPDEATVIKRTGQRMIMERADRAEAAEHAGDVLDDDRLEGLEVGSDEWRRARDGILAERMREQHAEFFAE